MELLCHRIKNGYHACIGNLDVDGSYVCHTLEDVVRSLGPKGEGKIFGRTAIPAGRYTLTSDHSQRFGNDMLHILDVDFFTGIRIHSGLTDQNTEGCVLTGYEVDLEKEIIISGTTKPALTAIFSTVQAAIARGEEVWYEARNEFQEALR